MNDVCKTLYSDHSKFHQFNYEKIKQLETHARNTVDPQELAEIGYTISQIEKLIDDTHKQLRASQEVVDHLLSAYCAAAQIDNVRTPYVTASPTKKMQAAAPKKSKNPEAYTAFCKSLGFDDKMIEAGLVDIRWPELCDYLTDLAREGKPLPPGIDPATVSTIFRVTYRGKLKPSEPIPTQTV